MTTTQTAQPTFEELAARFGAAVSAVATMDASTQAADGTMVHFDVDEVADSGNSRVMIRDVR